MGPPFCHDLGTAALERFTGYTGQSRSRQPTHTWNVSRLRDIDHGGTLAEDRTPDRQVLDALLRVPAHRFATHDDTRQIQRLLTERAEHEGILAAAPRDRHYELDRARHDVRYAEEQLHWAKHRLDAAHDRVAQLGPLSRLRRHGRHEKTAALNDIDRFGDDVARSVRKVDAAQENLDQLTDDVAQAQAWHAEHDWRPRRLTAIEAELASLGHIDLRRVPLDLRSHPEPDRGSASSLERRITRAVSGRGELDVAAAWWSDHHPEVAAPPLPGRDPGVGRDLGL